MTPTEYEQLVHELISGLSSALELLGKGSINGGRANLIRGESGFEHQIDVSVTFPKYLLLIECKYWKAPIDADVVLVLASRMNDIASAISDKRVHASVVSTKNPTAGAETLARHLGIHLDVVKNLDEYAINLVKGHFVGQVSSISISDRCEATVSRHDKS